MGVAWVWVAMCLEAGRQARAGERFACARAMPSISTEFSLFAMCFPACFVFVCWCALTFGFAAAERTYFMCSARPRKRLQMSGGLLSFSFSLSPSLFRSLSLCHAGTRAPFLVRFGSRRSSDDGHRHKSNQSTRNVSNFTRNTTWSPHALFVLTDKLV